MLHHWSVWNWFNAGVLSYCMFCICWALNKRQGPFGVCRGRMRVVGSAKCPTALGPVWMCRESSGYIWVPWGSQQGFGCPVVPSGPCPWNQWVITDLRGTGRDAVVTSAVTQGSLWYSCQTRGCDVHSFSGDQEDYLGLLYHNNDMGSW